MPAFPNVNIDLISGMVGETWDNWRDSVRRTIELSPDSVTIYQMELPFNTVYSQDMLGQRIETPVADWPTKRAWLDYAFDEFLAAGYAVSSAYTVVKDKGKVNFSYRDNLWRGQRSVGDRRGQLRARVGRALSESARLAGVCRRVGAGRVAVAPRHAADAAAASDPRDDFAIEDGPARCRLFPPQIRRRNCRAMARCLAAASGRGLFGNRRRHDPPDPRRPAECRRPAAGIFRAGAARRAVYVSAFGVFCKIPCATGSASVSATHKPEAPAKGSASFATYKPEAPAKGRREWTLSFAGASDLCERTSGRAPRIYLNAAKLYTTDRYRNVAVSPR